MNKAEKKKFMKEYRRKQMQDFEDSLPMERNLFFELFDYLNTKLEEIECNHDFTLTKKFLRDRGVEIEKVIEFLEKNGGFCDCEVILNVEEKFEK